MVERETKIALIAAAETWIGYGWTFASRFALLYDVSSTDPLSLGVACGVLLGIGAVAAYVPAHRATRIDPARALREGQ